MGYYINPHHMDKSAWLEQEGERTDGPTYPDEEFLPVCLVDNGLFTAAGIGYNKMEVDDWNDPEDYRPKQWYRVKRSKLGAVSDLPERYWHA